MSAPTMVFSNVSTRWLLYSFQPMDVEAMKKKFDTVMKQMVWKRAFDTEVLPRLLAGTRLVVEDLDGCCSNCYHYGPWDSAGSHEGFCANHADHEFESKVWMSWEEFRKSSGSSFHYENYTDYEKDVEKEMKEKQERMERYLAECERMMREYYN